MLLWMTPEFFFRRLEANFPLDGRTTLGFIVVIELLLAPGPQGGSANLVAGRTFYIVNNWGGVGEKQLMCTLHGALPEWYICCSDIHLYLWATLQWCCLPWKNILYIDILYEYIKLLPYVFIGHKRQISCEIEMKSLQSLCIRLFQEVQATSRYSISQWCFSHKWKQQWLHVVGISSHLPTIRLFCFTVAIPHKQDQNYCSDITTFFLYINNNKVIKAFFYLL